MLLSLADWFSRNDDLSRPHRGVVIENNDPKKRRRVKVRITGFLEGINLPWIYPKNPSFLGGGQGSIDFAIPEIGSEVIVEFPFKDIYFGFYTGHWGTKDEPKEFTAWSMDLFPFVEFDENYPDSYGFRDSVGNYFRVNKIKNTMEIYHKSTTSNETRITIRDGGQVDIFTLGNFSITNSGDIDLNTTGTINVMVPLGGAKISFNGLANVPLVVATVSSLGSLSVAVPIGGVSIEVTEALDIASSSINIATLANANILVGGEASINAAGKVTIVSGGDTDITTGGVANITAGGTANITAGGDVNVQTSGILNATAVSIVVQSATAVLVESLVSIAVQAPQVLLGPVISPSGYQPLVTEGGHFSFGVLCASS